MHNMLKTAFSGNDLGRTQTSGGSFKFKYGEAMLEDCENSGREDEIMEALCNIITDNERSSLRRSQRCEASRVGHASALKGHKHVANLRDACVSHAHQGAGAEAGTSGS